MALEDFRAEAERCSHCSYCSWVPFDLIKSRRFSKGCPSIGYSNFQSYSARGRYALALALLEGAVSYNQRVRDIVFQCQTCGSCDVACKVCRYNLEPLEMILELRARLVRDGQAPPQYEPYIKGLRESGNLLLQPRERRGDWADGLPVKRAPEQSFDVLFHAGCRFSYDENQQHIARTAVSLLNLAGISVGILGSAETCCGGRAYSMGYRDEFAACAEKNIAAWQKLGIKTVVTSCADGYHAFKRLYPRLGSKVEVLHTVEVLDKLLQSGGLKPTKRVSLRVTYHDPCRLGRLGEPYIPWSGKEKKIFNQIVVYDPPKPRYNGSGGVYDPPRSILKSIPGIELVEMERIREAAWSCGAGAGVRECFPDFADWTAGERLEEVKSTGAQAVVTACGWCERNFLDAIDRRREKIQVFDVAEIVQKAL